MTSSPTWAMGGTPAPVVPEDHPDFIGPRRPPVDQPTADLLAPAASPAATEPAPIDAYPDQPADLEPLGTPSAADPSVERAAWEQLATFIQKHKDPGTIIDMVDADAFANNS